MCEFCTQHGEGEKWYLTMENYSKDSAKSKSTAQICGGIYQRIRQARAKEHQAIGQDPQDADDETCQACVDSHAKRGSLRAGCADGGCGKNLRHGAGRGETSLRLPACDYGQYECALLLRLDHGQGTHGLAR